MILMPILVAIQTKCHLNVCCSFPEKQYTFHPLASTTIDKVISSALVHAAVPRVSLESATPCRAHPAWNSGDDRHQTLHRAKQTCSSTHRRVRRSSKEAST